MTPILSPGDKIADKYRILDTLGRGGMGVVYLAQHERLDRQVAIKLLHAQLAERGAAVTRFEREIKAMALVKNRHIAQALDADVLEDGSLFLVMEYLQGRNLRAELKRRGPIPFKEAAAYLIQACHGIAAVHDLGIVHRDLKPANLFLTDLDGPRCLKVLDFGIAKFLEGDSGATTETDLSLGTPLYMSPEQLTKPDEISPRSDVWALGVVLHELIAGVSPFAAATPGAVVAAVVLDAPLSLGTLVPEVPEELSRIVAGALTKSPELRIPSVRALAELLAPFALPIDAIFVGSSTPPATPRPEPAQRRTSMRPLLSAQIEGKVGAFDENARGEDRERLDGLRKLPSLGQLALDLKGQGAVIDDPTTSYGFEPVLPDQVASPEPPSRSRRGRWGLGAAGTLLVVGLVAKMLASAAPASGAAEAPRLPAPAEVLPSPSPAAAPTATAPSTLELPAPSASVVAPVSSQASKPRDTQKKLRVLPVPSESKPLPLAADAKPLHL
jgi:serine/threonine protein kinase